MKTSQKERKPTIKGHYEMLVDDAISFATSVIDSPPDHFRLVKSSIKGLVHLASSGKSKEKCIQLIEKVINNPDIYRSNPRRHAVRCYGKLLASNEQKVEGAMRFMFDLCNNKGESVFVRRAGYCALSRIARKNPNLQATIIEFITSQFVSRTTAIHPSLLWAIVIACGRIAQTNAAFRRDILPEILAACHHDHFRIRWAGIKAIGHMCCSTGDCSVDHGLIKHSIELVLAKFEECDPKTNDNEVMVQYACMNALGLIIRADVKRYYSQIMSVFLMVLRDSEAPMIVKGCVLVNLGKLCGFIEDDVRKQSIVALLFANLNHSDHSIVECSLYALTNYALVSGGELYDRVLGEYLSQMTTRVIQGERPLTDSTIPTFHLSNVNNDLCSLFLMGYCRLLSKKHKTVLKECADVKTNHPSSKPLFFDFNLAHCHISTLRLKEERVVSKERVMVLCDSDNEADTYIPHHSVLHTRVFEPRSASLFSGSTSTTSATALADFERVHKYKTHQEIVGDQIKKNANRVAKFLLRTPEWDITTVNFPKSTLNESRVSMSHRVSNDGSSLRLGAHPLSKTDDCMFYADGNCQKGLDCTYVHDPSKLRINPEAMVGVAVKFIHLYRRKHHKLPPLEVLLVEFTEPAHEGIRRMYEAENMGVRSTMIDVDDRHKKRMVDESRVFPPALSELLSRLNLSTTYIRDFVFCPFYFVKKCQRKSKCQYSHSYDIAPCRLHFVFNNCNHGERCNLSHDPLIMKLFLLTNSIYNSTFVVEVHPSFAELVEFQKQYGLMLGPINPNFNMSHSKMEPIPNVVKPIPEKSAPKSNKQWGW
ncbi:hypothetical protein PCE1_002370 [Barthelona sp. PCE]